MIFLFCSFVLYYLYFLQQKCLFSLSLRTILVVTYWGLWGFMMVICPIAFLHFIFPLQNSRLIFTFEVRLTKRQKSLTESKENPISTTSEFGFERTGAVMLFGFWYRNSGMNILKRMFLEKHKVSLKLAHESLPRDKLGYARPM